MNRRGFVGGIMAWFAAMLTPGTSKGGFQEKGGLTVGSLIAGPARMEQRTIPRVLGVEDLKYLWGSARVWRFENCIWQQCWFQEIREGDIFSVQTHAEGGLTFRATKDGFVDERDFNGIEGKYPDSCKCCVCGRQGPKPDDAYSIHRTYELDSNGDLRNRLYFWCSQECHEKRGE